jgi:hypothetical protein
MNESVQNFKQRQNTKKITIAFSILSIIYLMQLFTSCSTDSNTTKKNKNNPATTTIENMASKYEWFKYVDSVETIHMENCIDSFSMYTMKETAPEVISRNQFIFWKKGDIAVQGECDFLSQFGDSLIQVVSYGKSNVIVINYDLTQEILPKPMIQKVFDLEKGPYSGNCYEITKVNKEMSEQQLTIELHNSCTNRYVQKKVTISACIGSLQ